jgi:hypothetical protein
VLSLAKLFFVEVRQGQVRRGTWAACACALLVALVAGPGAGSAKTFKPPGKRIWHGVSDTGDIADYRTFNRQVRSHTALLQMFFHWGVPLTTGAFDRWEQTDTRGVLSLSTAPGGGAEVTNPLRLATGREDHYMLRLNESIDNFDQVVFIRPFAEMNLHINPYSAFNADGSSRPKHGTKWFRQAWRRFSIIVRGGTRAKINARLLRLGMPRIHRANSDDDPIYRERDVPRYLDRPKVALMWMPLTRGSPNVPGNRPRAYWPGRRYVDWVGTDTYAKFANGTMWANLERFYRAYRGFPFAIGEYGPWDNDYRGSFTRRIHKWARRHKRVRALLYFRSVDPKNEFNLQHYRGAKRVLRWTLNRRRYAAYAPGTRDSEDGPPGGGGVSP